MKRRITQVTTRGGDSGESSLADGTRLKKTDRRFEAIGTVDELNSFIGLLITEVPNHSQTAILREIQQALFDLGGALAVPGSENFPTFHDIEAQVVLLNAELPALTEFILPGGNRASALAHVCRTVCRRAERCVWALEVGSESGATYLNRLSDYFFVLARALNSGDNELQWRGPQNAKP